MNRGEVDEAELKERQARAMADPEVQGILTDPVMRQVRGNKEAAAVGASGVSWVMAGSEVPVLLGAAGHAAGPILGPHHTTQ